MTAGQTIVLRDANGVELRLPALWLKDGLGVSRAWGDDGFALTHVRTGQRLALFPHRGDAINCARAIAPLARWVTERPTAELGGPSREKIHRAIATLGGSR